MKQLAKKIGLAMLIAMTGISVPAHADENAILQQILTKVNDLPTAINTYLNVYLPILTEMAYSLLNKSANDEQKKTLDEQKKYLATQESLMAAMRHLEIEDFNQETKLTDDFGKIFQNQSTTPDLTKLVNAPPESLDASTVLGQTVIQPPQDETQQPDNAKDYIKHLAGINIDLPPPQPQQWKGGTTDKVDYINMYNSFASIQSFNSFVLSKLYSERLSHGYTYPQGIKQREPSIGIDGKLRPRSGSTTDLLIMNSGYASSADWYKLVNTEPLGLVFRHLLLLTSQLYVATNRARELQEQTLAAQTMTNTILMYLVMQTSGSYLLNNARTPPAKVPG